MLQRDARALRLVVDRVEANHLPAGALGGAVWLRSRESEGLLRSSKGRETTPRRSAERMNMAAKGAAIGFSRFEGTAGADAQHHRRVRHLLSCSRISNRNANGLSEL